MVQLETELLQALLLTPVDIDDEGSRFSADCIESLDIHYVSGEGYVINLQKSFSDACNKSYFNVAEKAKELLQRSIEEHMQSYWQPRSRLPAVTHQFV